MMTDTSLNEPGAKPLVASAGSSLLTLSGIAAAFGVAACCFLPVALTGLGLGTAWLSGIAVAAEPNRTLLISIAAISLVGGAVLLWRQQRQAATCRPNGACTPPVVRFLTLIGLIVGALLLFAGYGDA